ncbi:MAG TPA: efflux RND transporter permease subunit [Peptococcaceae bacterium]|nr:efflux RND transporter permease subunit [Peptococcaceae bacterium]
MNKIIEHRSFVVFFVILIVLLGSYAYYFIPKQDSPDVTAPFALITTVYPGASPEDVEKLVTRPIEDVVLETSGYKESHSYSRNSISIVVVELDNRADVEKAWTDLRQRIDDLQNKLPRECYAPEINTQLDETAGMIFALAGEKYSYDQLNAFAENLKRELVRVPGVARFEIHGRQEKEVQVIVRTAKLNQYNISLEDIYNILQVQNMEIPSGALNTGEMKINVRTPGIFSSISDIENTIVTVSSETGALVRLKDVATIQWGVEESSKIKNNGKNAILLAGYFQENDNIVLVGKKIRQKLEQLSKAFPEDLEIYEVTFQPEDISKAVNDFFFSLLLGMVLVIIVVFVGMGIKNALVAAVAIPLSILIAFIAMYLTGQKINEISIAALIVALGVLVDDAVVIIDAIQAYIDKGADKLTACLQGIKESIRPVFTATLVTSVSFLPILVVPGPAGDYMRTIPFTFSYALFASFAVAVLVTPVMLYIFYERFPGAPVEKESKLRNFFAGLLEKSLRDKKKALISVLVVFLASFAFLKVIPLQFFPLADKDLAYIDLRCEQAADMAKTEALAAQVEEFLSRQPEVVNYTLSIGDGLPKFYITLPRGTPSQDYAQVMMKLDLSTGRFANMEELAVYYQEELDKLLVGGKATVNLLEKAYPGSPLEIKILREDREKLEEVAELFYQTLKAIPGTINVEKDTDPSIYEFMVAVDNDRATNLGITKYDIQRQINIALKGSEASVYRKAGNEYGIVVKSDIKSKDELENLAIKSSVTGTKVLLKQFAKIQLESASPVIKKYDGRQCITVTSNLKPGHSAVSAERQLKGLIARKAADADISLEDLEILYQGETKDIIDNFSDLGIGALFGIFAIYVILMLKFGSFLRPLIIFATIPLSFIGVFLGLFLCRQPLSFTALIGSVSLMGLVIKNGILLIEYMNKARERGEELEESCKGALKRRYRPIITSSVTTIFGLVPLALSGSTLFTPMAVALMAGLLVSTYLSLVIIPLLYSIVARRTI